MGNPKAIGELIGKGLATRRLRRALRLGRVRLHWEKVVGPALSRRSRVVELRGAKALIEVTDPAARGPLLEIKAGIEKRLGECTSGEVREIIILG